MSFFTMKVPSFRIKIGEKHSFDLFTTTLFRLFMKMDFLGLLDGWVFGGLCAGREWLPVAGFFEQVMWVNLAFVSG